MTDILITLFWLFEAGLHSVDSLSRAISTTVVVSVW